MRWTLVGVVLVTWPLMPRSEMFAVRAPVTGSTDARDDRATLLMWVNLPPSQSAPLTYATSSTPPEPPPAPTLALNPLMTAPVDASNAATPRRPTPRSPRTEGTRVKPPRG